MLLFTVSMLSKFRQRSSLCLSQPLSIITRKKSSYNQSFKYENLTVNLSSDYTNNKNVTPEFGDLKFGNNFSEHMLEVEWTEQDGWHDPQIRPLHTLQLHPGAKVLHYAQAVFEGMKAFRRVDGKIALYRPEMNMRRFLKSSERACLPSFDCDELLKCIKKLVSIDKRWVPDRELCSLYIRPNFIGVERTLGIAASKEALLYVVTGPTGPYFKATIEPISLLADPNYVRACPGGVGSSKMASNYAPTLYVQKVAREQNMDQVLWLFGEDRQITEAGGMNVFFVLQDSKGGIELITPPLSGIILPGVVRQSVLDLGRQWKDLTVSERTITMKELIKALKSGKLLEMFVSGTAVSICPVKCIKYKNENIELPTMKRKNPLYTKFYEALTGIQYGKIKSDWSIILDDE